MNFKAILFTFLIFITSFGLEAQSVSVAHQWNEVLLESIRNDLARPTVHARNLWHTSAAMYDAWAIYDEEAQPFLIGNTVDGFTSTFNGIPMSSDVEADREEAISYAMYRILRSRFQTSPGVFLVNSLTNNLMNQLGYNINITSTDYSTGSAAALGNYIAQEIIEFGLQDNSNQQGNYDNLSYAPVNPSMIMDFSGNPNITDPNRWQPLTLNIFIDQSGNVIPFNTPPFLSPEWGRVSNFALPQDELTTYNRNGFDYEVYYDPGKPPLLNTTMNDESSEHYKWGFSLVSTWSSFLDPADGVMWDISPASVGNIPSYPENIDEYPDFYNLTEGGDPSMGHAMNPVTGQPYAPQMVPRADYARALAEFWADGPDSETPPGHWFTLLNYVSEHPLHQKKFAGTSEVLDDLEWDVKAYFTMGSAMHDAAVCTWGIKGWYDYIRPVSAIRAMAEFGQSTDASLPNYHVGGLPLIPGFIEVVEAGDPLQGSVGQDVGEIKVYAWRGPDYINNPSTDVAGVGWILAKDWWPYQRPSFVTPNFAGYLSGHSTFSSTAADIMTYLTGDAFFPGGMGEFDVEKDEFLVFEKGPSVDFTLQWATYRDASDQTSLSRIYGGIHPPADDIPGRLIGRKIAEDVFDKARTYFFRDQDNDGFYSYEDCDDLDPNINPNASEICDGKDNDCNGFADDGLPQMTYFRDADNDTFGDGGVPLDTCLLAPPTGYVTNNIDCNDANAAVNPYAVEVCDAMDNDCNGFVNDGLESFTYYRDFDNDTFGDAGVPLDTCMMTPPTGFVTNNMDCNDNANAINPAAAEICDAIDNDCNGLVNDGLTRYTYYFDNDNDSYGDAGVSIDTCVANPPSGFVAIAGDCNDFDLFINPSVAEDCDNLDNDCSGIVNDGLLLFRYYRDADEDSFGNEAMFIDTCITVAPIGYVTDNLDCDDADANIHPNVEDIADNGIDEDCSGFDLFKVTKIFPNPNVDGQLYIHYDFAGEVMVHLYSADGKKIRDEIVVFDQNNIVYDLGDIPAGIYMLRLFDMEDETYFVEKIRKVGN